MKRLRILQIFNRYLNYGGEEGSVYRIGDALQNLHEVEYFLSNSSDITGNDLMSRLLLPLRTAYNWQVLQRLDRFQKAGRFDVWQVHNVFPTMSPMVYQRAFQKGIPVVHYLHNYRLSCVNGFFLNHGQLCQRCVGGDFWPAFRTKCWHESRAQSGYMGLLLAAVREMGVFERVSAWVAISQAQKDVHERMGIPGEKITVVHHYLDAGEAPPPLSGPGHVLFVGRLSEEKGVRQLLTAWREVRSSGRKLYIVGDGPEKKSLETHAQRLGLDNVVFTGFLPAEGQKELWEQALFSVVPSVWLEPFGMTVLEAWRQGRPVIVHDLGALPELVEQGRTGLVVDHADTGALAAAMERLLNHPEEARVMGLNGRAELAEKFNREAWLEKMRQVYENLVQ